MQWRNIEDAVAGVAQYYIDEWSNQYKGEPDTSWENIFDNVLFDFLLYCDDEASGNEEGYTLSEMWELNMLDDDAICYEFEQFVDGRDLEQYDVR